MQADTVRVIGIDYVCWLNFELQFYNQNRQQMSMIWINYVHHTVYYTQNPDQNPGIPWWSLQKDLFAILQVTTKSNIVEGKQLLSKL